MPESEEQDEPISSISRRQWYCLRTQTKREHIAASMLTKSLEIEVFCPRISQIKKTRTGKKRFVEAMFPGYLFARFRYSEQHRQVMHSQGVTRIVEQADRRVVPDAVIEDLRASIPEGIIEAPDPSIEPGAQVEFVSGSLQGLSGKVLAALPSGQRVEILLEFLGREIRIETDASDILLAPENG